MKSTSKRRSVRALLVSCVVALAPIHGSAAQGGAFRRVDPGDERILKFAAFLGDESWELFRNDETRLEYEELVQRMIRRETQRLIEEEHAIGWTQTTDKLILGVVHLVLLAGLCASASEFLHARRLRAEARSVPAKPAGGEDGPVAPSDVHELKVGLEGVAVKTSRLGVLILAFAFGFYFLYVKFVYPVIVL